MNIVLVYPPPFPLLTKPSDQTHVVTGLGLLYLATQVKDKHNVSILGASTNPTPVPEMIERITALKPDVLGISTIFTTLVIGGKQIAAEIKKRFPNVFIIFGGNHATFTAKELLNEPYVDVVVKGEGEITFKELIDRLDANRPYDDLEGLVYKKDGQTIDNPPRKPIADIDSIPFPDWSIITDKMPVQMPVNSSRGCPNDCIYCSTTSFWTRKWRARSAQNIIDEIKSVFQRFQPEEKKLVINFVDDNFTVNRKRVMELCRLLGECNFKLLWGCSSRVELLDDEILRVISQAGCNQIFMGIESGSARVLRQMKRHYTPELVKEKVELCLEYGIIPTCSFMVGNPFEDRSDVEETFALIGILKSYKVQVHIFTPLIGTPVYRDPQKYGVEILSTDSEKMTLEAKAQLNTCYLSSREIEELYNKGVGLVLRRHREAQILNKIASKNRKKMAKKFAASGNKTESASDSVPAAPQA
ncbi:MAG: radical SAM protein [bacterium]|nr:radical SAM protein [bacterium]